VRAVAGASRSRYARCAPGQRPPIQQGPAPETKAPHIAVADADVGHVAFARDHLQRTGFRTTVVRDGLTVLSHVLRHRPVLVLINAALPAVDARDVAISIRRIGIPVLMVGTTIAAEHRARAAARLGADDYLGQPYSRSDLTAKIRRLLVHQPTSEMPEPHAQPLILGALTIGVAGRFISIGGTRIECTAAEYDIILTMAQRPNSIFTRAQLAHRQSSAGGNSSGRVVDMHISNLRKKIEPDPHQPRYLKTVYGYGYMLVPPDRAPAS
jgi:DNA-binding response OmpR family regulator